MKLRIEIDYPERQGITARRALRNFVREWREYVMRGDELIFYILTDTNGEQIGKATITNEQSEPEKLVQR